MATEEEIVRVDGREVVVTNPGKVFFSKMGATKLDLVRYYLAVAPGALAGAGGRPMALKRFVNGAAGEAFFQKRAPNNRPEWLRTVTLSFPSGRTADEIVVDDDLVRGATRGEREGDRPQPLRSVVRRALLEERLARRAVHEPLQRHRPPTGARERARRDSKVVPHQVELRRAHLGEE